MFNSNKDFLKTFYFCLKAYIRGNSRLRRKELHLSRSIVRKLWSKLKRCFHLSPMCQKAAAEKAWHNLVITPCIYFALRCHSFYWLSYLYHALFKITKLPTSIRCNNLELLIIHTLYLQPELERIKSLILWKRS